MKKQTMLLASTLALLSPISGHTLVDEIWCQYPCGINPSLPPCEGCGFSAEIDYLYWKPYQDNNSFATVETPKNNQESNFQTLLTFFANNKIDSVSKNVKYDWDSGFRIGLGVDLPCFYWNLAGTWTHYDSSFKGATNTSFGAIIPSFLSNTPMNNVQGVTTWSGSATALWKLQFNQLDFDLKREVLLGYGVSLLPYIGIRGLFLKENYNILVDLNQLDSNDGDFGTTTYTSRLLSEYKGFGLKAGMKTHYELFCGLGFFGDFALASMYGDLESSHHLDVRSVGDNAYPGNPEYSIKNDTNCLRTSMDLQFGVEWRTIFDAKDGLFFIRFGWEHHTLFDQNNFLGISGIGPGGNPTIHSGYITQHLQGGNLYLYGWTFAIGGQF